ncbi:BgTH12-00279 [Blumeria graminis f. sp. triticale]|uniref:Bgt-1609 n=3 Tax=Blumeria graminis TaxID=34373 RepID=A0A381LJ01_BLUGR|nr:thioredoxin [Blumeria graminis f. sp. tritici 96224]CAD6504776.1 BgTH12-00279 [Blumeria graminis f. sp. triticale]VDB92802.1 Bgt-1609 [Blumeria graminis f. sp. tritici]
MSIHDAKSVCEFDEYIENHNKVVAAFVVEDNDNCKKLAPEFKAFSTNYPDIDFVIVDTKKIPDLCYHYCIRDFPTFVYFKGGKRYQEVVGPDKTRVEEVIRFLRSA